MEKKPATLDGLLTAIAQKHLNIQTLEERKNDSLDFHSCPVWLIKKALQAAFNAGVEVGIAMTLDEAKRK